ncbi:MAG: RadC family protein [Gallionellaceae bacterium]
MQPDLLSDLEILSLLMGKKTAARMYQGSLLSLFTTGAVNYEMHPRIGAARELVKRALKEELKHGSVLLSPVAVRDYIRLLLIGKEYEAFVVIFLNAQHSVIEAEELFRGTLTQTSVYPREVVKRALRFNASAVILAHNHPSGIAEPSRADELLTQALKQSLALVDIKVLDHFVVAGTVSISFAERGLI